MILALYPSPPTHLTGGETTLSILGIVAGVTIVLTIIGTISAHRGRRLKLVEDALNNPSVDEGTRRLLVADMTKPALPARALLAMWSGGKLLVAIGWIGMFVGVGLLASGDRDCEEIGIPLALMGFAVLSLPFAMRELDSRRHAPSRD